VFSERSQSCYNVNREGRLLGTYDGLLLASLRSTLASNGEG
jgi:hypothetical protein